MKRFAAALMVLMAVHGRLPAGAQVELQSTGDRKIELQPTVERKIELQPIGELETRLSGWVDLHTHPMSHLGFGGKAMHGAPDQDILIPAGTTLGCGAGESRGSSMAEALAGCNATHGGWGLDNSCGDYLRAAVISNALDSGFWHVVGMADNLHNDHSHAGYPDFDYWPHFSSKLHQQMWWEWLQRAHAGGLRVLVALTVNSETLAEVLNGNPPYDDKTVANKQIDETIRYVNRHRGFMEIARTAAEAERIIRSGRLAVILGMEVDKLGNFGKPGVRTDEQAVRQEIRRLHAKGVRYVFPIHLIDNAFGGSAVFSLLFNMANRNQNGSLFQIAHSPDPLVEYQAYLTPVPGVETAVWHAAHGLLSAIGALPGPPDCFDLVKCRGPIPCLRGCGSFDRILEILEPWGPEFDQYSLVPAGHVNARGLSPLGRVAIDELMRLGMLIDVDHMSERALRQTVGLADAVEGDYPLILGHTKVRGLGGSERDAPTDVLRQIARSGGMMGLGTSEKNPTDFVREYDRAITALGGEAGSARERGFFGLGTDANGFEQLPHRESTVTSERDGPLRPPFSSERVITVPGDAWNQPAAQLACAANRIDIRSARIGCLDVQRSDNLTAVVAAACTGRTSCAFQAPTESEYRAMGVLAATRSHCTQAMEIVYRCSERPTTATDSQIFYNSFFRDTGLSARQRKPNGESWDYIQDHGVSHYGLMPEFLHDVSLRSPPVYQNLLRGADGFVRMWDRAEAASVRLTGGGEASAIVSLRSHHGRYVVAEPDGSARANRDRVGPWERFVLVEHADGQVSLRGAHGMYLVAEPDGRANADRWQIGAWERFQKIDHPDGTVSFRGAHGNQLVAEPDGSLKADRPNIGAWEKFSMRGEE